MIGVGNIMCEKWAKWLPIEGLSMKYYVDEISDCMEGFVIKLSDSMDESKKIKVIFGDSVWAYRSTDESLRQETINLLDKKYGAEFYAEYTFFKVTDSEYIKWIEAQSYKIFDSKTLIHFSIIAVDSIVDVIATYEPEIINNC